MIGVRANTSLREFRAREEFLKYSKGKISLRGLQQGLNPKEMKGLDLFLGLFYISLESVLNSLWNKEKH